MFGYNITPAVANQVHAITEGWITAVYLVMQRYAETGALDQGTDIDMLMETALMARYTADEARLLMSLSILNSFTPEQAVYLTGVEEAAKMMQKLSYGNSLIRYDGQNERYILHNIFGGYLRKLLAAQFDQFQLANLYRLAGEWEVENGNLLGGLKFFLEAKEYDLIMTEFEKPGITRMIDAATAEVVDLFRQVPAEAKYRHPFGYVKYANFYLINVDMRGGAQLLDQIEAYYRDDQATPQALKTRITGEITLTRSFLHFNDVQQMHSLHLRAHELLEGSSSIANKEWMFTFGSPHTLYLYYREEGQLLNLVEVIERVFHCFQELSHGCGTGFEHLARAEYCLETGDLDGAESYARKAIFKAQPMDQVPIIICAQFTLARMWAARGQFSTARSVLDDLTATVAEYDNPVFDSTLELCLGYMGGILGEEQDFAPWLRFGDMKHSEIFYQGMAFHYLMYAKYLLLQEDFLKLEVLCEELHQHFSVYNNLLGHIHAHILDAAAKKRLYGLPEAKAALLSALNMSRADALILPFAEYGTYVSDLLKALEKDRPADEYLKRLSTETAHYKAKLQRLERKRTPASLLSGGKRRSYWSSKEKPTARSRHAVCRRGYREKEYYRCLPKTGGPWTSRRR